MAPPKAPDKRVGSNMRNVPPCFLVSLLLPLLSGVFLSTAPRAQQLPSPFVPANGVYWDCEVVEHLYLWKEGFRSFPTPDPKHGSHLIINMRSGEVSGPLPDLQWSRMPVVKTSPDYNVFMTRGHAADGTPVNEVVLYGNSQGIQFVSIDLLTSPEVLDGTCK